MQFNRDNLKSCDNIKTKTYVSLLKHRTKVMKTEI